MNVTLIKGGLTHWTFSNGLCSTPLRRFPKINGQEIDLYLLYSLVTAQGGWIKVFIVYLFIFTVVTKRTQESMTLTAYNTTKTTIAKVTPQHTQFTL